MKKPMYFQFESFSIQLCWLQVLLRFVASTMKTLPSKLVRSWLATSAFVARTDSYPTFVQPFSSLQRLMSHWELKAVADAYGLIEEAGDDADPSWVFFSEIWLIWWPHSALLPHLPSFCSRPGLTCEQFISSPGRPHNGEMASSCSYLK